jgi:Tol biopolymer transport system component
MSVTAPPRPPRPPRPDRSKKPLSREEIEALVEALIEEVRQETRRRHRRYWALAALVTFVGVVLLTVLDGGAASQTASPAVSARMSAAAQVGTSKIAFTSFPADFPTDPPLPFATSELYVVNADGSDKRLVARSRTQFGGWPVAWSPDGQTIAFIGKSLFFVNADGSGKRNVARELGLVDQVPVWSPDGKHILFTKIHGGQKSDIYVMNADGSGTRRLTHCDCAAFPIWSPNGKKIAFGRDNVTFRPHRKPHVVDHPEVWVMNADGSGQRRLTRGFPNGWSPDGKKIAFRGLDKPGLYVVNADGSGRQQLTRHVVNGAAWSPDGRKIVFSGYEPRTRGRISNIYVINANGSGQRELKLTERGQDPRWSPDGEKIAFVSSRQEPAWYNNRDGNYEIYVINADGSGLVNVSQTPLRDELSHAWSPGQK